MTDTGKQVLQFEFDNTKRRLEQKRLDLVKIKKSLDDTYKSWQDDVAWLQALHTDLELDGVVKEHIDMSDIK